jgi:hypothetical protein
MGTPKKEVTMPTGITVGTNTTLDKMSDKTNSTAPIRQEVKVK